MRNGIVNLCTRMHNNAKLKKHEISEVHCSVTSKVKTLKECKKSQDTLLLYFSALHKFPKCQYVKRNLYL